MVSINNQIFPILIKSTDNNIADIGATSLSEALRQNTTLVQLDLGCGDKKKQHANEIHQQLTLSHSHLINRQQVRRKRNNFIE